MTPDRDSEKPEETSDLEHLKILSICYYVLGAFSAFCSLFPGFYLAFGIAIVAGLMPQPPVPQPPAPPNIPAPNLQPPLPNQKAPAQNQQAPPPNQMDDAFPEFIGWMFIVFATLAILLGWAYSICLMVAGRMLGRQRRYVLCMVTAGLACLQQPLGVALGVFTFIVLSRKSVKERFRRNAMALEPRVEFDPHDRYETGE